MGQIDQLSAWAASLLLCLHCADQPVNWVNAPSEQDTKFFRDWFDCLAPELPLPPEPDVAALDEVHVVFGSDARGFAGLLRGMLSLAEHVTEPESCTIHIFVSSPDVKRAKQLLKCFHHELLRGGLTPAPKVRVHVIHEPPRLRLTKWYKMYFRYCPVMFARLYLHEYLPDLKRAIWLDNDIIVNGDVRQLYRMRMRHPIAASPNPESFDWARLLQDVGPLLSRLLRDSSLPCFNTGVLVYDLARWRLGNFSRSLEDWIEQLQGVWREQLAMPMEFQGAYDVLDWRWNFDGLSELQYVPARCMAEAKMLHFSGRFKPFGAQKERNAFLALWESYSPRTACAAQWLRFPNSSRS